MRIRPWKPGAFGRLLPACALLLVAGLARPAGATPVTVSYHPTLAGAHSVAIAGSFNAWSTTASPLADAGDGTWTAHLDLAPGRYEYKFVVNGDGWFTDTDASDFAPDGYEGLNSVIVIADAPVTIDTPAPRAGGPRDRDDGSPKGAAARDLRLAYDTYRNAATIRLEGTISAGRIDDNGQVSAFTFVSAGRRFHLRFDDPRRPYEAVSNGSSITLYVPNQHVWGKRPADVSQGWTGEPTLDWVPMLIDMRQPLEHMAASPGNARWLRTDKLPYGPGKVACDVIENRMGAVSVQFWFDPVRGRILRRTAQGDQGPASGAVFTIDYTRVELGAPVADSEFAFVPPPGAHPAGGESSAVPPQVEGGKVTFTWRGGGSTACVAGDFNAWSTAADPMTRHDDGSFTLTKSLSPGKHPYKFVIDGTGQVRG